MPVAFATATGDVLVESVNLQNLEDKLYQHGLAGFRRIRRAHPHDRFYCLAFYTCGEFSYVLVTASSYEGLERVANEYKQDPSYESMSLDDLRLMLKWSPCDRPLHGDSRDVLVDLDPLLESVVNEFDRRFDLKDGGKSFDEFTVQVRACFAHALQRIGAEDVFGDGNERKRLVVNLLMGDQSDEDRIEFASRVNPHEAVDMLRRDLDAGNAIWAGRSTDP